MNPEEFKRLPFLLGERDVVSVTGYAQNTIRKYVDNGVLTVVKPAGSGVARFRKVQVARLIHMEDLLDWSGFAGEPLLMPEKQVTAWTGYARGTLLKMVQAGALFYIRRRGSGMARYQKRQIAALIGYQENNAKG